VLLRDHFAAMQLAPAAAATEDDFARAASRPAVH
jgi:hypothetical protein